MSTQVFYASARNVESPVPYADDTTERFSPCRVLMQGGRLTAEGEAMPEPWKATVLRDRECAPVPVKVRAVDPVNPKRMAYERPPLVHAPALRARPVKVAKAPALPKEPNGPRQRRISRALGLTPEAILDKLKAGMSVPEIAAEQGVCKSCVEHRMRKVDPAALLAIRRCACGKRKQARFAVCSTCWAGGRSERARKARHATWRYCACGTRILIDGPECCSCKTKREDKEARQAAIVLCACGKRKLIEGPLCSKCKLKAGGRASWKFCPCGLRVSGGRTLCYACQTKADRKAAWKYCGCGRQIRFGAELCGDCTYAEKRKAERRAAAVLRKLGQ